MTTPSDDWRRDAAEPPLSRREARDAAARAAATAPPAEEHAATEYQQPSPASVEAPVPAPEIPAAAGATGPATDVDFDALVAAGGHRDDMPSQPQPLPRTRQAHAVDRVGAESLVGMDALFEQEPPVPHKPKRSRRGCLAGIIVLLLTLALVVAGGWFVVNTFGDQVRSWFGASEPVDYDSGLAGKDVLITIKQDETGEDVSSTLHTAGVTKTSTVFYNMLVRAQQNPNFQPGVYKLRTKLPAAEALKMLEDPANRQENAVLVREGEPAELIYESLAETLKVPLDDVKAAAADPKVYNVGASSLEGWLFPATYEFQPGTTPQQAIQRMVDRMDEALTSAGVQAPDRQRVLTLASIIQREAIGTEDMGKVSRVIENRLQPDNSETHGLLQMDSTVQYGVGKLSEGTVTTTDADRENDNAYNTYKHAGLPVGPIASPGDAAIKAAVNPTPGPWFYFVTVDLSTGETAFSTTFAEHEEAVKKFQTWCQENPGKGC